MAHSPRYAAHVLLATVLDRAIAVPERTVRVKAPSFRSVYGIYGCGLKLNRRRYAGFGPCFHLPGFHFDTGFLSHSHIGVLAFLPKALEYSFKLELLEGSQVSLGAGPSCSKGRALGPKKSGKRKRPFSTSKSPVPSLATCLVQASVSFVWGRAMFGGWPISGKPHNGLCCFCIHILTIYIYIYMGEL